MVNGDVFTDYPFGRLPQRLEGQAHLVLVDNPPQHPEGDFALRDGRVDPNGAERHTFSGVSVLSPALFDGCEPGAFALAPLLRRAMERGRVTGEHYGGYWVDVGTLERLQQVDRYLREKRIDGD
ncbi:hypothetical protein [Marinobacterium aestuariivivens]|uniref:Nucleotidyl transferase domain-containing protein n=1 Tax=Marinobacterium aestuariivivens TaxID=1698799 RepID=A0ABW1ZWW0_9GAMM